GYDGQMLVASRGVDSIPAPAHGHHHGHEDHHAHEHHEHEHDHSHEHEHEHEHHDEAEHHHHHGAFDPHAWHDVANGIIYVCNITKALVQADPARAAIYRTRSRNYIHRLR